MSSRELILAYLKERARLRLFVPLSILLALAGRLMVPASSSIGMLALAAGQAFVLMLAFRIWDDLADRDADRVRHPARVTVTTRNVAPLYALGIALMAAAALSLVAEPSAPRRLAALSIATAVLLAWYALRSRGRRHHALGEHVLAVKYPLFAYAVAPELPSDVGTTRAAGILVALYVLICVYEYTDDVELRQLFTSRRSAP
jgi:4-hydroxybenzoate polyprenyltransferase